MKCPECSGKLLVWEAQSYEVNHEGIFFREPSKYPDITIRCLNNDCPINDQFELVEEERGGLARIIHDNHNWGLVDTDRGFDSYTCPCGAIKAERGGEQEGEIVYSREPNGEAAE